MQVHRAKIEARRPQDLERAWSQYYTRLAEHFVARINRKSPRVVLEAGCGKGQLTLPLIGMLPKEARMIAIDSSRGPYTGWLTELKTKLRNEGLQERVRVIKTDVRGIRGVRDKSVDLVVSNELLCDLPYDRELEEALRELRRILKPHGLMIHGEWSSFPTMDPQSFLVKHWPSWSPDQLFSIMKKHGFQGFEVSYFDTTIHFGYETAVEELRGWGADNRFLKRHERVLRREGLDLPFEHVIQCHK
jgi:ubiquinone/menaquinone biosynthesis C-methylase UbiE